jgi:hypothetical protein
LNRWTIAFPDFEPLAHEAKLRFTDRWVRFHSLPGSKRYPENQSETAELLSRFNSILSELTAAGETVFVLTTEFGDKPIVPATPTGMANTRHWRTVVVEDYYWHVYLSPLVWQPHSFDKLIRAVAMDLASNVMICDPQCQWLVHRYDGGTDVVLLDGPTRDRLKSKFADRLSARADGL